MTGSEWCWYIYLCIVAIAVGNMLHRILTDHE